MGSVVMCLLEIVQPCCDVGLYEGSARVVIRTT